MADREGRPWWDSGLDEWRCGFPTYWVMQYGGSGLWHLSYGAPHYRGWAIYKGSPYRDMTVCLTLDSCFDERVAGNWREFDSLRQEMNAALKAALSRAKAVASPEQAADADFAKLYPLLHGFVTEREGEKKGEFRETASMLIFAEDGSFKLCLNDRDTGATLWKTSSTVVGLFQSAEEALGSSDPGWRQRKAPGAKGGQRKGKGG